MPAILNAANEVAVDAFLQERIRFTDIPKVIEDVLGRSSNMEPLSLSVVKEADAAARVSALEWIAR